MGKTSILKTNGTSSSTKIRPANVGTYLNIPDDLCTIARLNRNDVVAWTTVDQKYYDSIEEVACNKTFGMAIFPCLFPCLWPFMIVSLPCLLNSKIDVERTIENTYWVMTETDLKVIVKNYDGGCLPGCYHVGDRIKSIPYDTITDCGISAPSSGCVSASATIPTVYVDTASSSGTSSTEHNGPEHEAVGYGLKGYNWFVAEILFLRDGLKNFDRKQLQGMSMSNMDRGSTNIANESVESRIQKIKELHKSDIITTEEYEKKRQEIIASI
jgi:hypothetical protein